MASRPCGQHMSSVVRLTNVVYHLPLLDANNRRQPVKEALFDFWRPRRGHISFEFIACFSLGVR